MVGFAIIVGVVAIVILLLLVIYLRSSRTSVQDSYEVESFIQAVLQYTTECQSDYENLSVEEVVTMCGRNENCLYSGRNSCEVLNSSLNRILEENWAAGEERPIKGYEMRIKINEREVFSSEKGRKTGNYKGSTQILPRNVEVLFRVYS